MRFCPGRWIQNKSPKSGFIEKIKNKFSNFLVVFCYCLLSVTKNQRVYLYAVFVLLQIRLSLPSHRHTCKKRSRKLNQKIKLKKSATKHTNTNQRNSQNFEIVRALLNILYRSFNVNKNNLSWFFKINCLDILLKDFFFTLKILGF